MEEKTEKSVQVFTLISFVKKYGAKLPMKVRIEEGYCGSDERYIIVQLTHYESI